MEKDAKTVRAFSPEEKRYFFSLVEKRQVVLQILFAGILLCPFFILFSHVQMLSIPDLDELLWCLKNTFIQAFASALLSVGFGIWGALGLISLKNAKSRIVWELVYLMPNFLPPLFVILALFKTINPFPLGLFGLIAVHLFMNAGLVAVLFARILDQKVGSLAELAMIEGAGRFRFAKTVFKMLSYELSLLFWLVFSICFVSFSVPLLVGGDQGTTLEVLIFEKVRLETRWDQALTIALLQATFLFAFSFFNLKAYAGPKKEKRNLSLLSTRTGLWGGVLFIFILCFGLGKNVVVGFAQLEQMGWTASEIFDKSMMSLFLGLCVGALCFLTFQVILLMLPGGLMQKFLRGYLAPSTALTSFAILLLGPNEGFWPYGKLAFALVLIFIPLLYRLGWEQEWMQIWRQWQVAKTMGAGQWLIYKDILLPQTAAMAGLLSGLGALWASGDFAVSSLIVGNDFSLALVIHSLVSFYRLNAATALSLLLILIGGFCFTFFWGVGHVLGQKSKS